MTIEFRTATCGAVAGLMLACSLALGGPVLAAGDAVQAAGGATQAASGSIADAGGAPPAPAAVTATGKDATRAPTAVGAVDETMAASMVFYGAQADEQWMASRIIGATVVDAEDKAVGAVTDLILGQGGAVDGVVVGVGGFLGVGEKKVAAPFSRLQLVRGADGKVEKISLALSRDDLEKAPTFVTLAEKKSHDKASQPVGQGK